MNFGFSEEQDFLRDAARKFLDERCPMSEVRALAETRDAHSPALWKELADLGWLGLLIPEEHGGAGMTWIDLVVVLQECGRGLLPSPLLSTALTATAILEAGSEEQQKRWLPGLANGSQIGTLALLEESDVPDPVAIALRGEADGDGIVLRGAKHFVADAGCADLFVVAFRSGDGPGALGLAVVPSDATGVTTELVPAFDETKRSGTLILDGVRVPGADLLGPPGESAGGIGFLADCGAVGITAEALGAGEGAHALTVQYAKDRVQFGSPIGRYQGVKHRLSDMWVDNESIKSLLYYAAWAVENSRSELPRYASLAKAYTADAFTRIGVDCVQLHGAVGYTLEYDIQLYLKRSKWVRPMFGDADYHRDRIAALRSL